MNALSREARNGFIYAFCAYALWGLLPVYFKFLSHVPALEIVAHRVLWAVLVTWLLLLLLRQPQQWLAVLREPRLLAKLAFSAMLISINWGIFVWAVAQDRILDTSLGYFINPLFTIAIGVLWLREDLSRLKLIALICASIGVAWQVLVIGGVPWVSLGLACSFSLYSLMRKKIAISALNGLMVETLCLLPVAAGYLWYLQQHAQATFLHSGLATDLILVLAGVVTVVPLALFSAGAQRLSLTSVGFMQYLTPSGTLLLAIFVYHEPFNATRFASFGFIWLGLGLLAWDALRQYRRT